MGSEHRTEEVEAFLAKNPEIERFDMIYSDLCNLWRGKRLDRAGIRKLFEDGAALPGAVFLLDVTGDSCDPGGRGYSDGSPDHWCYPVPGALARVPWATHPTAQVLISVHETDGTPFDASPRNVLARVIERLADLPGTLCIAAELEFYLIDPERDEAGFPQAPVMPGSRTRADSRQVFSMADLDAAGPFLDAVTEACSAQGIPASMASSEYAPAQMEINLHHVDNALLAADHAVLLQRVIKACARKIGLEATFMAKPFMTEEGNGLHFHISHYSEDGENLFDNGTDLGSQHLHHAIGGLGATMGEAMAIFGPNVNAFRRLSQSLFAGTTFSWGANNRWTSVRLPVEGGKARRLEHRVAGADANPYLTLAAILAGMHHGITNKIDPGPPQIGDKRPTGGSIATTWQKAIDALDGATVLRDYLGSHYVDIYVATKQGELNKFYGLPSKLEYDWYLGSQ